MSLTAVPNTPTAEDEKLEMLCINIRRWRKEKELAFRHQLFKGSQPFV